jgi:hypothetical protein
MRGILIFVVLLLFGLPMTIGFLASSSTPLVLESAEALEADQLYRVKKSVKELKRGLLSDASEADITVVGADINGLMAFIIRRFPQLTGRTNISRFGLESAVSIYFPENPFGDYINLSFGLPPTSRGIVLSHATIGAISIPGETALTLVRLTLNLVVGSNLSESIFNSVQSIDIDNKEITLRYRPIPDLKLKFESLKERVKAARDEFVLVTDPAVVGIYYERLCRIGHDLKGLPKVSFSIYLTEGFTLAAKRTAFGYKAIDENRATLMALAIYLGSTKFDSFIGISREGELAKCRLRQPVADLANREDLRLHFIYSAALKVLSDSGSSFAIGEMKEMLDSVRGGSGFSFADLAADRAGIRLAEFALDSQASAIRLQEMVQQLESESTFFPMISDLTEGISQHRFENELGGIKGQYYAENLAKIMDRIADLPLYREPVTITY